MKTLIIKGEKMNKKYLSTIAGGIVALVLACLPFCRASAWGPERTTYTIESPAPYAVFNSITNNNAVGDERNFVRIGEAGSSDPYEDEIEIVPGKEYEVYIYYHNNAASNTNSAGYGMATNTRISSAYPTIVNTGERGMISGIISWSYVTPEQPNNAQTGKVWDEAYVTTKTDGTVLRYKTGTAVIHNAGAANGSVMPTALFTEEGAPIGFNKLAGTIPGCAEYSGYITYTLVAEKIDSSLEKYVSLDGENWGAEVTAKPGEYVTYKVVFRNTGNTKLTNVIFKDTHDEGLTLRTGSTTVFDINNENGTTIDDILDISGYNTGDSAAGALVQITYQAKVSDDETYCNKSLKNTITVTYNSGDEKEDTATVLVACDEPSGPDEEDCSTNPNLPGCQEKNCKTNPEMEGCQELPSTGPLEIVMAIVVALGIGGGGYYLYHTRKTLNKVENEAKGETQAKSETQPTDKAESETKPEDSSQNEDNMVK